MSFSVTTVSAGLENCLACRKKAGGYSWRDLFLELMFSVLWAGGWKPPPLVWPGTRVMSSRGGLSRLPR